MELFKQAAAMDEMSDLCGQTTKQYEEILKRIPEGIEISDELETIILEHAAYRAAVGSVLRGTSLSIATDKLAEAIASNFRGQRKK
jgi:hypothetical protein